MNDRLETSLPTQVNCKGPGQKYPLNFDGGEEVRLIVGIASIKTILFCRIMIEWLHYLPKY